MADEVEKLIAEIEQRNALRNKQNAIDYWLSEYERYFAQTSNPLCVWSTISVLQFEGRCDAWLVLAYLIETAAKMHGEVATADPEAGCAAQPESNGAIANPRPRIAIHGMAALAKEGEGVFGLRTGHSGGRGLQECESGRCEGSELLNHRSIFGCVTFSRARRSTKNGPIFSKTNSTFTVIVLTQVLPRC